MVYAVVTCFNQVEKLKECLSGLFGQAYDEMTIVVVDDGSVDGTSEVLEGLSRKVETVQGDGSLFWGGGVALGFEHIKSRLTDADYVFLVNCDAIVGHDCVLRLVEFLESKGRLAIAHALTLDSLDRKTIIGSGSLIRNWPLFITHHPLRGKKVGEIPLVPQEIHTVTARALLVPWQVIKSVGFVDGKVFRHYGGDSDFGLRCYSNGFQPYLLPSATCYLDVQSTGVSSRKSNVNLAVQLKSLFSIRSANNLINRWNFGRNCPLGWRPFYYLSSVVKVVFSIFASYARYLFSERLKGS